MRDHPGKQLGQSANLLVGVDRLQGDEHVHAIAAGGLGKLSSPALSSRTRTASAASTIFS